jgi:senataxin
MGDWERENFVAEWFDLKKLVRDSKRRGCFYDAVDDKNLRDAMNNALPKHKVDMSDVYSSFRSLSIRKERINAR